MKNKYITIQNHAYECWYINKYCVHCYGQVVQNNTKAKIAEFFLIYSIVKRTYISNFNKHQK